jgi:hypothetical protein
MATFSNLGIKLLTTGDEAGTWGTTTNTNFEYFDASIVGVATVVLVTAGSSGTPNQFQVTDYTAADARKRLIEFTDAGDLGGTVYVQIAPTDFVGYWFIRNSLSGSRTIVLFQGTYNAARDYEIPAGKDVIVRCTGTGATSYVYNAFDNLNVTSVAATTVTATTATVTTVNTSSIVSTGLSVNSQKITNLATPTAGTDAATKAYVDSAASGIAYVSGNQTLFRASSAGTGSIPSGWTIAAQNNKALRISSGTPSSGGATAFTSVFNASITSGSTALTIAQMPAHTHTIAIADSDVDGGIDYPGNNGSGSRTTGSTGSGAGHTHAVTMPNLQYYDFNVIQKT